LSALAEASKAMGAAKTEELYRRAGLA
jgi:hypothetical protein